MKRFFYGIIAYLHEYLDRFEIFFINAIEWAFLIAFAYFGTAVLVLIVKYLFT
jgi:hypothetical protein